MHRAHLLLTLLVLALPTLGGCTLVLPLGTSIGDTAHTRNGQPFTVADPPRVGVDVEIVLDDGSEVAGQWRGATADGYVAVETPGGIRPVEAARVVQIRSQERSSPSIATAALFGLVIDVALFLRHTGRLR